MKNISFETLTTWQNDNRLFTLVDVREPDEHAAYNIGGELIPLSRAAKTPAFDPEQPVVVYCKRGIRSQIAIQRWESRFPTIEFYNLEGGLSALKKPF